MKITMQLRRRMPDPTAFAASDAAGYFKAYSEQDEGELVVLQDGTEVYDELIVSDRGESLHAAALKRYLEVRGTLE